VTTVASASTNAVTVIVKESGPRGLDGTPGTDGVGFNNVRRSLLDNPTLWLYKKNRLANVLSGLISIDRASDGTFKDFHDLIQTELADFPREGGDGWLIERASTNEALHNRDLTNAAWVKINITAALDATGNDGIANVASSLTATAALGTAFQTVTKASAENTYSVDVRRKTGTGTIEITDDGGSAFTDITSLINSIDYTRFEITSTQANPSFGFRITTNADAIEVDYNQLEQLSFATSRIETTTVAVVRVLEKHSFPVLNNVPFLKDGFTLTLRLDNYNEQSTSQDILTIPDEISGTVFKINTTASGKWEAVIKGSDAIDYKATTTIDAVSNLDQFIVVTVSNIGVINIFIDGNVVNGTATVATALNGAVDVDGAVNIALGGDFKINIKGIRFYDFVLNTDEILYLND